jgi:hypothetical protein
MCLIAKFEIGLDKLNEQTYTRSALQYELPLASERIIRFLVEEMNNIDSKAFRYNVNTEFQAPIRRLFNKEMKNTSISLGANYGYISPQFTQERRELVGYNFLYQEGHQANIYSKLKTGHFTWFGNARFSKTPLFVLGVKKSFKWTKKGPH